GSYKPHFGSGYGPQAPTIANKRFPISADLTLAAFEDKFKNNDIFRSATQISEVNLVPDSKANPPPTPAVSNYNAMSGFWTANNLTGDNLREKPYVDLYPRLTTKSNVFTIHIRAQSLKKSVPPNTPA